MSRLSNRVRKLETSRGAVDMEQLQRDSPDLDLSILSDKHLRQFAEMKSNTAPRPLCEFSNRELHDSLAFSVLFAAHAAADEAAKVIALSILDDKREFTTDELKMIGRLDRPDCHAA